MVPTLADVRALRRLANCVQAESARQLFELMEIFSDWGFGAQPRRLRLSYWLANFNLYKLGRSAHLRLFYRARWLSASIITSAILRAMGRIRNPAQTIVVPA